MASAYTTMYIAVGIYVVARHISLHSNNTVGNSLHWLPDRQI